MQRTVPKHGKAFNGIDILSLPPNRKTIRKGFKVVYDPPRKHVGILKPRGLQQQQPGQKQSQDLTMLVKGIQTMLRKQKTHESHQQQFTGFNQVRPIR